MVSTDRSTSAEMQDVIMAFMRRAFAGAEAFASNTSDDDAWVVTFIELADQVTPAEIASWPNAKQWSLFTLLREMVAAIEIVRRAKGEFGLPAGLLKGSSSAALARPLLRGFTEALTRNS